jgi:hypothetical protein
MTIRRWPSRNFLAELSVEHEPVEIDDLARRERSLRRLMTSFSATSEIVRAQVRGPDWIAFSDARTELRSAEFEAAFNLGFEHGVMTAPAERADARPPARLKQFRRQLRVVLGRTTLTNQDLLGAMLDLCAALAKGPPDAGQGGRRVRNGRKAEEIRVQRPRKRASGGR